MYKDLGEKISYEYNKYLVYLRLMSNADLITRAYEISVKKMIYIRLQEDIKNKNISNELAAFYMKTDSLIDNIYLHATNKKQIRIIDERITDEAWNLIKNSVKF